jgi:nucleoside-diphosphate-sugar epimerase
MPLSRPSLDPRGNARTPSPRPLVGRLRLRARLLVSGCGDVGLRLLRQLAPRIAAGRLRVIAVTRDAQNRAVARTLGALAPALDLDERRAVNRLGALARRTIHLAPPPPHGEDDLRIGMLIAACGRSASTQPASSAASWVVISTSGVYGDCDGAEVDETWPLAPATARARRRAAAEQRVRSAVRRGLLRATILRVPGIYAQDRLPLDRLRRGLPAPLAQDDVHTNHIHAEDLARIAWLALHRGRPGRVVNTVDDSDLTMGDWFDRVADATGLPRPPRLPRAALARQLSPTMLSFMGESRKLSNRRMKQELRVRLRWPTVDHTLAELAARGHSPHF